MVDSTSRSDRLPLPPRPFQGQIGITYTDSEPDVSRMLSAPENAPNVLVILLDDVGFGHASTFGGPINTPTLQKLADEGLRYNCFHTTALCSPTRAALLTGRNHHSAHTGVVMEMATAYPGYDGRIPKDCASIAEILKQNGYNTAAFGKWHLTPAYETSIAGPFDRWATGLGFEHWWGFHGGETDNWNPPLYENTTPTQKPQDDPNWHLSEGMAEKCITWIAQQKAAAPDKPFFAYWAPGAGHSPHHVAKEWADRYKGKFDHGWDRQREITFERQKQLGVIPPDTQLTPRPDSIPAWDDCSVDEKQLYARMQEVFAGFIEHVDAQIGKVVDTLETMNLRENTLIIYIVGDNGPSPEGSLTGTLNGMKSMQGFPDDVSTMLKHIDEIGSPRFENNYPVAWGWAGSSPFQWMKQIASHFGGTRNPMVVSYPGRIKDKGRLRSQFHHVIDLAPTILEVAGIPEPREVNGVPQRSIEGTSMVYTWDDKTAPSRRTTQYFEILSNRALYHNGWVAGCRHGKLPWQSSGRTSFEEDTWELYNIETDFSQATDLASQNPRKLRELQDLFMVEAAKYNVLPLDDRFANRADANLRPSYIKGKQQFVYLPNTVRLPEASSPNTKNVHHTLAAEIIIPEGGAEGVLVACGGLAAGYTLFIKDNKLHWEHNWFTSDRYRVSSTESLSPGQCRVSAEVKVDEEGKPGTGGNVTLRIDDRIVGEGRFEKQVPYWFTFNETFDVGCDTISPVSDAYESPFTFTGTIKRVLVDLSGAMFDDRAAKTEIAMALQ